MSNAAYMRSSAGNGIGGPLLSSTPSTNLPPAAHLLSHNGSSPNLSGGQVNSFHLQNVAVPPMNSNNNGSPPLHPGGNSAGLFVMSSPEHATAMTTSSSSSQGSNAYMQQLTQEIEKERSVFHIELLVVLSRFLNRIICRSRVEYQAKSRHIEQQLAALKFEIEDLKVDEKMTPFDHFHTENSLKGGSKYSTLNKVGII